MLELFIANKNYSSWSLRPWVLLRQLNIPFTERLMPFRGDGIASAFDRFSPTAKVPWPLSTICADYAARMLALGPMREWYQAALEEPWRDPEHEQETQQTGELLQDLRVQPIPAS